MLSFDAWFAEFERDKFSDMAFAGIEEQETTAATARRKELQKGFKKWLTVNLVKGAGPVHQLLRPLAKPRGTLGDDVGEVSADIMDVLDA